MVAWDAKADADLLSPSDSEKFGEARHQYFKAESIHTQILKQKSRIRWALEGDENTAFFHSKQISLRHSTV